jgi:hypothetical protein
MASTSKTTNPFDTLQEQLVQRVRVMRTPATGGDLERLSPPLAAIFSAALRSGMTQSCLYERINELITTRADDIAVHLVDSKTAKQVLVEQAFTATMSVRTS